MGKLTTFGRFVVIGVVVGAVLGVAACQPDATPTSSRAGGESATATQVRSRTPEPTSTPLPAETPTATVPPTDTPTSVPTSAPTPSPEIPDCVPGAAFEADVTIPDNTRIEIGEPFVKTWRIGNTGTCEWGAGYHLDFAGGDQMGGPASVAVGETTPDGSAEVSVELVAPETPGTYRGEWGMASDDGGPFGGVLYVQIVAVDPSAATPEPTQPTEPTEPAAAVGAIIRITGVNKSAEYVDIQNEGDQPQDLAGWVLVSEKGNQACALGGVIGPGEVLRIWALAKNVDQGGFNCGIGSPIWNNSERDPAVLYDASGQEVSRF